MDESKAEEKALDELSEESLKETAGGGFRRLGAERPGPTPKAPT